MHVFQAETVPETLFCKYKAVKLEHVLFFGVDSLGSVTVNSLGQGSGFEFVSSTPIESKNFTSLFEKNGEIFGLEKRFIYKFVHDFKRFGWLEVVDLGAEFDKILPVNILNRELDFDVSDQNTSFVNEYGYLVRNKNNFVYLNQEFQEINSSLNVTFGGIHEVV